MEIFEYALPFTWKTLIPQEWTFDNYIAIFKEFNYGLALKNTTTAVQYAKISAASLRRRYVPLPAGFLESP